MRDEIRSRHLSGALDTFSLVEFFASWGAFEGVILSYKRKFFKGFVAIKIHLNRPLAQSLNSELVNCAKNVAAECSAGGM